MKPIYEVSLVPALVFLLSALTVGCNANTSSQLTAPSVK